MSPEPTATTGALSLEALPWIEFVRGDGTTAALPVEIPTRDQYSIGLSGRYELGERGMLFHWDDGSRARSFWMKNTHIDLDIAFIGPDFVIQEIFGMEAESLDIRKPAAAYQYAVEAPSGWYATNGVEVGDSARFLFDLADFQMDGDLILMRALDDLAGCAAALAALSLLSSRSGLGDVYGVFTRAEEVGLVGARLLAEAGTLPSDTLVVSLEASRTLPGAAIGGGPVIRVGDASLTFDADAEAVLVSGREELMEAAPGFEAQRQLMSGGTCEASAFRYHGYRTTGVAFPLGNYHNGTPLGGVAEEYIHVDDFVGGVELIVRAAQCVSRRLECRPWRRMADLSQEHRGRLEAGWGGAGPAA